MGTVRHARAGLLARARIGAGPRASAVNNRARLEENYPCSVDNHVLGEEAEHGYSTMCDYAPRLSPFEQVPPGTQGQGSGGPGIGEPRVPGPAGQRRPGGGRDRHRTTSQLPTPHLLISVSLGGHNSGDTMRQGRTGPHRPGDGGIRSHDLDDPYVIRASDLAWRASSRCAGNGSCAEVAQPSTGRVAVRDGMNPQPDKIMIFTQEEWGGFLARIKAGQFDVR